MKDTSRQPVFEATKDSLGTKTKHWHPKALTLSVRGKRAVPRGPQTLPRPRVLAGSRKESQGSGPWGPPASLAGRVGGHQGGVLGGVGDQQGFTPCGGFPAPVCRAIQKRGRGLRAPRKAPRPEGTAFTQADHERRLRVSVRKSRFCRSARCEPLPRAETGERAATRRCCNSHLDVQATGQPRPGVSLRWARGPSPDEPGLPPPGQGAPSLLVGGSPARF